MELVSRPEFSPCSPPPPPPLLMSKEQRPTVPQPPEKAGLCWHRRAGSLRNVGAPPCLEQALGDTANLWKVLRGRRLRGRGPVPPSSNCLSPQSWGAAGRGGETALGVPQPCLLQSLETSPSNSLNPEVVSSVCPRTLTRHLPACAGGRGGPPGLSARELGCVHMPGPWGGRTPSLLHSAAERPWPSRFARVPRFPHLQGESNGPGPVRPHRTEEARKGGRRPWQRGGDWPGIEGRRGCTLRGAGIQVGLGPRPRPDHRPRAGVGTGTPIAFCLAADLNSGRGERHNGRATSRQIPQSIWGLREGEGASTKVRQGVGGCRLPEEILTAATLPVLAQAAPAVSGETEAAWPAGPGPAPNAPFP